MRTWDDNRETINQLWPMVHFTDEEIRLWHEDLSGLDQSVLYDAIRNVKRNNDTLYPQLKWVRDEYRRLDRLRSLKQARKVVGADHVKEVTQIAEADDKRMSDDIRAVIETLVPSQWQEGVDLIKDKCGQKQIELATAHRLCAYLNERLGVAQGGRVR